MDKHGSMMKHTKHFNHGLHVHNVSEFKKRLLVSLILTIPIIILSEMIQEWFGFSFKPLFQKEILFALSLIVYFYSGYPFLKGLIDETKKLQPGMMTLVGTAISVAFIYSSWTVFVAKGRDFFWELVTLIDAMLLGHWMEAKSVLGASKALEELVKIMPVTAHVLRSNAVIEVPVSELKVGDIVIVKPGEKIPSDGTVIEGNSLVNESLLTGESKPIPKVIGDSVIGGSINGEGSLKIRVERTGEETYLMQVVKLVKQAQESKSKTQDLANKAAAMLFYIAATASLVTYSSWLSISGLEFAFERAVTVLVVACPHALGLAIPLTVAVSTSVMARNGILVRNRRAFEKMRIVNAIVFDKTGTLTKGSFIVTDIVSSIPKEEFLSLVSSVEMNSEHVIAKAIVSYAKENNIRMIRVEEFKSLPGAGAYGRVGGREVYIGGLNIIRKIGIDVSDLKELQEQGKTTVFVIVDGRLAGFLGLSDEIREESYEAVKKLKELGLRVYMLTGDSESVAKWVAKELGIDDYFSQITPDKKVEKIKSLKGIGLNVAMVGDGVNDAPALATADVGVAIGAGTDVAIESADIILVKNDPRDVVKAIDFSKKTYAKMVQNLIWAVGYNVITIPLAAGAFYNYGISLPPALGALIMSMSTIIVALNSQILKKHYPSEIGLKEKKHIFKDPVCGMNVKPEDAQGKVEHEDYVIYFCSRHCQEEFSNNIKRYLQKLEKEEEVLHEHLH
ncbi:MAG: heavy metal translocating P-type ATPase [Crenarchaeota archaeon]|nr:heavy metal translocating P-type ATPase [Thermoproteota archaeon]MDW8034162.1 heavy metal translocating P-type ATPase [Nitrososphaerota archaeon]